MSGLTAALLAALVLLAAAWAVTLLRLRTARQGERRVVALCDSEQARRRTAEHTIARLDVGMRLSPPLRLDALAARLEAFYSREGAPERLELPGQRHGQQDVTAT